MSSRKIVSGVALGIGVCVLANFGGGCLSRPVTRGNPETVTNFTEAYTATGIDKVDILFDIDNSSSMGDKQQYLQLAVPDLINRLVSPNCVNTDGTGVLVDGGQLTVDSSGNCSSGRPEFPPVHDLHVGVVTSSLGPRGTTSICQTSSTPGAALPDYNEYTTGSYQAWTMDLPYGPFTGLDFIPKNNDDQGHLVSRTASTSDPDTLTASIHGDFLAWVPSADGGTAGGDVATSSAALVADFQSVVAGAGAYGCGIESQLESWYRFLIQPDPYASIVVTNGIASWQGVDDTILQQRADFLRPDSLVLIVVLTDENDSEIDVRTLGGNGYNWLDSNFQPSQGTTECSNPTDPKCTSCNIGKPNDPNCANPYPADQTNWAFNDNLRHVHMKQKYGVDVQFPIGRYFNGLTSPKVPNRAGEYPSGATTYQGGLNNDPQDQNCDNPLFSMNLPTKSNGSASDPSLCTLTPNPFRTNKHVYFAHIGGVPHELLTTTDSNGDVKLKTTLTQPDWTLILGADPENYDYSGIDSHMIESYLPRGGGIPEQGAPNAAIVGDEAPDWVTNGTVGTGSAAVPAHVNLPVDREYACVFKLAKSRDCDETNPGNSEADIAACDCSSTGLAANEIPPVCDSANPTTQLYAKAYPTIRELLLAKKLESQGIVSSICPIHVEDNPEGNDPLYGYRPAISSIVTQLKGSLGTACLPETLPQTDAGTVPCIVLVTLPSVMGQDESACNDPTNPELFSVNSAILADYKTDQHANYVDGNTNADLSLDTTCEIQQVLDFQGTCANNTDPSVPNSQGWCYVTGGGACAQSLQFSAKGLPSHGIVSLQCLENSSNFGNSTGGSSDASMNAPPSDAKAAD
jgi:hypothetical protein